ncbi:hypothetical protein DWV12_14760 [Clostridium botulinum]|uniref:hypothetical protein n=1 Tax=Clostridium botulinum TaxID=1491 RepID=UPI00217EFEC5|nr:hypothetical protein [Clostridium botulinum]MCS6103567.1 hypothetical protein [Clostridium botulinum]MCS6108604.1 hypothetical protein [Clostridium botulinum]
MQKIIVDKNGFAVRNVFVNDEMEILFDDFILDDNMQIVDMYDKTYIKSKWDFDNEEWTEGATQEEIKEREESNKPKPQEPTETELLQKQLLETQKLVLELQYKLTNKDLEIK